MKNKIAINIGKQLQKEGHEKRNPSYYVISREEFEELQAENDFEVEGLTYEEYCEIESECWREMLSNLLESPVNKTFNEFMQRNLLPQRAESSTKM